MYSLLFFQCAATWTILLFTLLAVIEPYGSSRLALCILTLLFSYYFMQLKPEIIAEAVFSNYKNSSYIRLTINVNLLAFIWIYIFKYLKFLNLLVI